MQPDVFLSYSHMDRGYVDDLVPLFEEAGLTLWFDDHIEAGSRFTDEIEEHLERSAAVAVLMSSHSKDSDWVGNEIEHARGLKKGLFPLLLEGEPWLSLRAEQYVDVRDRSMPPPEFFNSLAAAVEAARRGPDEGSGRRRRGLPPQGMMFHLDSEGGAWQVVRVGAGGQGSPVGLPELRQANRLVQAEVGNPAPPSRLPVTLHELLMPAEVAERLAAMPNLILEVDDMTAPLPWEMLAAHEDTAPLSIGRGIVRQVSSEVAASDPATARRALVIGDPPVGQDRPPLPGAREEAEAVSRRLEQGGFEVVERIAPGADADVLSDLLAGDIGVLHVAAHGAYRPGRAERSGPMLGESTVISPLLLRELPAAPMVVFLDCAHLPSNTAHNRFAADLAGQLVRDGVRAVVVAGWAVDASAAAAFADVFYKQLVSGRAFGDAAQSARRHIFNEGRFRGVTWGAHQCWGDPGFRLTEEP